MSFEGLLELPDYDGGPRDQLRDAARQMLAREAAARKVYDPNYEYAAQWYADSSDSWVKSGWHGDRWTTLKDARHEADNLRAGFRKDEEIRVVRRRKPGPEEVVE